MNQLFNKFDLALLKTLEFVLLNNRQNDLLLWGWESEVDFKNMHVALQTLKVEELEAEIN